MLGQIKKCLNWNMRNSAIFGNTDLSNNVVKKQNSLVSLNALWVEEKYKKMKIKWIAQKSKYINHSTEVGPLNQNLGYHKTRENAKNKEKQFYLTV